MKSADCDIVIVIPVFKQPGFLVEALESVLRQEGDAKIRAVVVVDGCPFEETEIVAKAYSRASDGRIACLRRQNGGLSAARNTGITYALQAFPSFRYLFLLDADNRISPLMMERMMSFFEKQSSDVGWLYPDIDMFGYTQHYTTSGDYSILSHILENYCEAGSFIGRRVIDAGVRFDEAMRHGFEDWDFWLQAAENGFRGVHMRDSGFQYRRRAESMLVGSERMRETIIGYMRLKHAKLLKPQSLLQLEEIEAPRFIEYELGNVGARTFVDPRRRGRVNTNEDEIARQFVRHRRYPSAAFFPGVSIFSAADALDRLARAGLDRAILWLAQNMLRDRHFVIVSFRFVAQDRIGVELSAKSASIDAVKFSPLIIGRGQIISEAANDPNPGWIASILGESPGPLLGSIICTLPAEFDDSDCTIPEYAVAEDLLATVVKLGKRLRGYSGDKPDWRTDARRPKARIPEVYSFNYPCGNVLPHISAEGRKQVGFILPLVEFGGVEKVVLNYARVFRDTRCDVHLFVTNETEIGLARQVLGIFASINFLAIPDAGEGDWDTLYYGAGTSKYALSGDTRDALGLMATMDIVLNTHSIAAHGVMATLRKQGVKTYVGLHLVERSKHGHPVGNPNIALPYEHVYDGFVVISDQLASWCVGRAIPRDKIIIARNAASYVCDPGEQTRALERRRSRSAAAPLRILYLGRLDAQKGIDRIHEIMRATRGPQFEWRIVGKAVLADAEAFIAKLNVELEPPALTNEDLDRLYAWADVFVLPSRFEGVPLTILEAQRFGCIPLATNVGAVSEIIENGVDGFLFDNEKNENALVSDFVSTLKRLAASPDMVAEMAEKGHARQLGNSWEHNLESWLDHAALSANRSVHA